MRTPPPDLPDAAVADAVRTGWGLALDAIDDAPLGFGSHHWWLAAGGRRWFVTVDDLAALRRPGETSSAPMGRLVAALSTARLLSDAGLHFVVAPLPSSTGAVVERIGQHHALAVYPSVEGVPGRFGPSPSPAHRRAIVDVLAEIHGAPASTRSRAHLDDRAVPGRVELAEALAAPDLEWGDGPFGEAGRVLLAEHRSGVAALIERFDELVDGVLARDDEFVVTHGEPHPGNTIATPAGLRLIDWDTARLAPPERDLWMIVQEEPAIAADYAAATGRRLDEPALECYRLRWDLADIAGFVAEFRRPHGGNADTRLAFDALRHALARHHSVA